MMLSLRVMGSSTVYRHSFVAIIHEGEGQRKQIDTCMCNLLLACTPYEHRMSTEPILLAHSFCQRPQVYLPCPSPCGGSNVLGAHRQVCYDATSHAQHLRDDKKL